jgi:hypothetical protein
VLEAGSGTKFLTNSANATLWTLFGSHKELGGASPYLFILATNVLGHMMADLEYRVEGLSLPWGGLIRDQTFTDDIALYLKGSPPNMDRAQNVLKIFCQAFGAKINWHKSIAI